MACQCLQRTGWRMEVSLALKCFVHCAFVFCEVVTVKDRFSCVGVTKASCWNTKMVPNAEPPYCKDNLSLTLLAVSLGLELKQVWGTIDCITVSQAHSDAVHTRCLISCGSRSLSRRAFSSLRRVEIRQTVFSLQYALREICGSCMQPRHHPSKEPSRAVNISL